MSKILPIHICSIPWWLPRNSCNKLGYALCWIQVFFDEFPTNYRITYIRICDYINMYIFQKIHMFQCGALHMQGFSNGMMSVICPLHWETRTQKCHRGVHVCNAPGRRYTTLQSWDVANDAIQQYSWCAGCLTFNRFTTTKGNSD